MVKLSVMPDDLLQKWSMQAFDTQPFFLNEDRKMLAKERVIRATTYNKYAQNKAYMSRDKKVRDEYKSRLHENLLPVPFQGNLTKADIFICLVNPGLSRLDYIAEKNSEYREVLKKNLKQEFSDRDNYPFFSLDPKWLWTGGGTWWAQLFRPIIQELIERKNDEKFAYNEATRFIAKRIAALELIPYHSANSGKVGGLVNKLPSALQMKDYVRKLITNRVEKGEALLILASGGKKWEIREETLNVVPQPSNHRKAVLSLEPGCSGFKILEWLLR